MILAEFIYIVQPCIQHISDNTETNELLLLTCNCVSSTLVVNNIMWHASAESLSLSQTLGPNPAEYEYKWRAGKPQDSFPRGEMKMMLMVCPLLPVLKAAGLTEGKSGQKWTHSLNLFIPIPLSPPLQVSYLEPMARNGREPTTTAKIESRVAEEEWGFWGGVAS